MKIKEPTFLELLESFFTEHMPLTAGFSDNTVRLYKATFRLLMRFLYEKKGIEAERITFQMLTCAEVSEFLNWLEAERKSSVATRNIRLAALSSFASYAQNRNSDAAIVFLSGLRRIPAKKTVSAPGIFFTREEVSVLLRIPDESSDTGRRDAMLFSLMYASGARAQELCDLKVRDVLFEEDCTKLVLTGKGQKKRRILLPRPCADSLRRYLIWRRIDERPDSHVFSSRTHEHMTISCVEEIFKKHLKEAKRRNPSMFLEKRYTPHTMRHTTAMHMLEAGVPLMSIKNFLGHAYLSSTERYAQLTQGTVDKHIREWNQRWFGEAHSAVRPAERKDNTPDFLK